MSVHARNVCFWLLKMRAVPLSNASFADMNSSFAVLLDILKLIPTEIIITGPHVKISVDLAELTSLTLNVLCARKRVHFAHGQLTLLMGISLIQNIQRI